MKKALYWFSYDLRLQDNCSLASLVKLADQISFVYVVDPRWFSSDNYGHKQVGAHRWHLIYQSLQQVNSQLREHGHQLHILYGRAEQVIVSLVKENKIDLLGHAQQVGIYEQSQWQCVQQSLPQVGFVSHWDSTLFSPNQLALSEENLASFSKFRKSVEKASIDPYETTIISLELLPRPLQITDVATAANRWAKANTLLADVYDKKEHHNGRFKGGELYAIEHVIAYFESDRPSCYKTTRNALDGWDNSTKMSYFLALGNLSARQLWHHLKRYESRYGANESTYWIGFELLWREYFQWLALQLGTQLYRFQGGAEHEPVTQYFEDRFIQWCEGNTLYPLVNACMKELNSTGYMSNRGRQIVASCLVNELGIDWRFGAAYFQQQLIDHDVASNWGNWQYIAGVGADPRGGRHFNIEKQTQQYDPDGHYINKWQVEE
ncbi:DASH family cryptochrome [Aliivibrio fischeri]|uniref:DASH family cryptochrome n=1 Tax=Aliivibrio fischeri TaxID=668 RepID=UPI0007C553AC|nr:DASH family cryptochrome [Aliivibrio fischeri]